MAMIRLLTDDVNVKLFLSHFNGFWRSTKSVHDRNTSQREKMKKRPIQVKNDNGEQCR